MARPAALGSVVVVQSLDDADLVLTELSYLEFVANQITNEANAKINAIKDAAIDQMSVIVEGNRVTLKDRSDALKAVLHEWIAADLTKLLKDDAKSIELAHGTIGLRQRPLAIEIAEGKKDEDVITALNAVTMGKKGIQGWFDATLARLVDVVKGFGPISDFIAIKFSLNMAGIKKAYKDKRVKAPALASIHLKAVDPYDAPFISPSEYVVSPE